MPSQSRPFPYFRDPHHPLTTWTEDTAESCLGQTVGPGFVGPFSGDARADEVEHVCEACLRVGRLDGIATTNDASTELEEQLEAQFDGSSEERETLARERTLEVQCRTPRLVTWQDFEWPAHCADYCVFVEELGLPEIEELAKGTDPKQWLVDHLIDQEDGAWGWSGIRRSSSRQNPEESYGLTVYRFDCRECGAILVHWDSN